MIEASPEYGGFPGMIGSNGPPEKTLNMYELLNVRLAQVKLDAHGTSAVTQDDSAETTSPDRKSNRSIFSFVADGNKGSDHC